MYSIQKSLFSLFIFLNIFSQLGAKQDHRVEDQPLAFEKIATIPASGVLKQKANGFVYLDVSNDFVTEIIPLLEHPGELQKIPTAKRSVGAHISIFDESEDVQPEELDKTFDFVVQEIRSFVMHTRDGLKKLWVISVNAPELEQLRMNYGRSPKLKNHDFHITLGKQIPSSQINSLSKEIFSSFNFSEEPTIEFANRGDFVTVQDPELLNTIARINQIGQLHLKSNGFAYLNVNNGFIDEIIPHLPLKNAFEPVSTSGKKMGAHISVIYEDEMIGNEIWELEATGEWFTFEVKELRYVDVKNSTGKKRLWLLAVDSPALQRLRQSYGLKPKLQNHDFHITLGSEQINSEESLKTESFDDESEADILMPAQAA